MRMRHIVICGLSSCFVCLFDFGATAPQWARASSFARFLDHTQRRTTVDRTPLDEWSARRIDLYLTTHNTHNTQTSTWQHNTHNRQTSTWQHTTLTTHRPLPDNTTLTTHRPLPDNTQNSKVTDIHAPRGIRTHNLSRWTAAELRLGPSGHWDRFRKKNLLNICFDFLSNFSLNNFSWQEDLQQRWS